MGCPAKSEVQNGACSALIKLENRDLAGDIIKATQEGVAGRLPVSVKTRLGFNEVDMSWFEFLFSMKLNMLTIHGRTKKEMSKVPAHWDLIGQVASLRTSLAPATLVVGNGDVQNHAHGISLAKQHGVDGIMIGRGIFQDPFVFSGPSPWPEKTPLERVELYRKHVQLFADTWQNDERHIKTLNKFCKVYISDFDGAKEFREQLMEANSIDELLHLLTEVRDTISAL
jgi:tRNA-dihydrouridine synthase